MTEQKKHWYEIACDSVGVDLDDMITKALGGNFSAWCFLHDLFLPHSHEVLSSTWHEPKPSLRKILEELQSSRGQKICH